MAAGAVVRRRWPATLLLAALAAGCDREYEGGGELRAQRVVLEREVEGLRAVVARLQRGEPLLPPGDVAVAIDDTLVREVLLAQLPFSADVDRVRVDLTDVDVQFAGSPTLQLRGRLQLREQPDVTAAVTLFGALDEVAVEDDGSTLRAVVAADHLSIENATGLAAYLSGATLDELARTVRLEITKQLPVVRLPISVSRAIDVPAITDGPVRLDAGRLALDVSVSRVAAARGRLFVAVRVTPRDASPGQPASTPGRPPAPATSPR